MNATRPTYNEDKFKELILYISDRMEAGATMLNKVLFFSDFYYYAKYGHAITGAEYRRLKWGPVPKRLLSAREALVEEGRAVLRADDGFAYAQTRIVPTQNPNLDLFSAAEIKLVDEVIAFLRNMTASEVSEFSHRMIGWKAAEDKEDIPYSTVFLVKTEISESDLEVATEIQASLAA